jgi:hypothetical protein
MKRPRSPRSLLLNDLAWASFYMVIGSILIGLVLKAMRLDSEIAGYMLIVFGVAWAVCVAGGEE